MTGLWKRIWAAIAPPAPVEPERRSPMAVSGFALDRITPQANGAVEPFTPAEPMDGVVPAGGAVMAMDWTGSAAFSYASLGGYSSEGVQWLGYPYLSELAQRPEYRRASEIIAKEMTRKWIKINATGEDDKSDRVREIEDEFERLKVRDNFHQLAQVDGFFGRAQLYIDVGAGPAELDKPLLRKPEKIKKGTLKSLNVVEPYWTYPANYNSTNPLALDFYKPQAWYVNGKTVHHTRLLTFVGREVPDLLKPAYSFGGLSLSQMGKPYVDNWLRTRQSVSDLIHSFSVPVLKTNLSTEIMPGQGSFLSGGSPDGLINRVEAFNLFRDNRGTFLIDKTEEDFAIESSPLSSLDKLQAQSQEQMASVWGIPLVVYCGVTPSGLNASSDGEIKVFYAWVNAQQEHFFRPGLQAVFEIAQLSLWGEIDPSLSFTFVPLWQMSETDAAIVRKTDAETDSIYITDGVISPHEARVTVATAEESRYAGLDLTEDPDPPIDPAAEEFGMPAGKPGVEQK